MATPSPYTFGIGHHQWRPYLRLDVPHGHPDAVVRVLVMRALLFTLLYLVMSLPAMAQKLPGESQRLLPMLAVEIDQYWPTLAPRAFPAGIIDQESNWKPNATLRTSREWGCGLK